MQVRNRRGFTLIELLVVIAIIAILAAILFPVFAQARAKARATSCLSNVKQLSLGMIMYAQDYDEAFPLWRWDQSYVGGTPIPGGRINDASSLWWNAIYPYVKSAALFNCPDNKYNANPHTDGHWGWFDWSTDDKMRESGLNPAFFNQIVGYGTSEPLTYDHPAMASLDRPADALLIADMATSLTGWEYWDQWDPNNANGRNHFRLRRAAYPNGYDKGYFWADEQPITGPFNPVWQNDGRHSNGNNIGFADGHAKYRPVSRVTIDLFD